MSYWLETLGLAARQTMDHACVSENWQMGLDSRAWQIGSQVLSTTWELHD